MKGQEFLDVAEYLLRNCPVPAGCRSAVSRAYYAAHHICKEFVESAGVLILSSHDAHADLWQHLAAIGDPELEAVGSRLASLRGERNTADYKLGNPQFEKAGTVQTVLARVREVITVVEGCRQDRVRLARVQSALRARNQVLRGV